MSPTLARQIAGHPAGVPGGQVAPVRSGRPRRRARRAHGPPSAPTSTPGTRSTRPRSSCRSTPTSWARCPGRCATSATSPPRRRVRGTHGEMSRLYAVESTPTTTGSKADHRLRRAAQRRRVSSRAPGRHGGRARRAGGVTRCRRWQAVPRRRRQRPDRPQGRVASWWPAISNRPPCTPWRTPSTRPSATPARRCSTRTRWRPRPSSQVPSLRELVADMANGAVDALFILGGNPVYDAPADLAVRRRARQGALLGPPEPLRRRDVGEVPVARAGSPLPREPGATPARSTARPPSSSR